MSMTDVSQAQWEEFRIPSMDCAEEFRLISSGVSELPGVQQIRADYLSRVLNVSLDHRQSSRDDVMHRLQDIGFPAVEVTTESHLTSNRGEAMTVDWRRRRLVVGLALLFFAGFCWWFQFGQAAVWLAIASTVTCGWSVATAAWQALRRGHVEMNTLMVLAGCGALAVGEYFEAATAMSLFGVSHWLESLSVERANKAVTSLVAMMPQTARRWVGDPADLSLSLMSDSSLAEVAIADVSPGDHLIALPGERIPSDGLVVDGTSHVNQAPITGESLPIEKSAGDEVFAGSLNGESPLLLTATRPANDSMLARVRRLVEEARSVRAPTERFVDRFARIYTPFVIGLAVLIGVGVPLAVSLISGEPLAEHFVVWFHRGLVLLVIACPCALVISTPITIVCGLQHAASRGMIVKGGDYMESLGVARAVLFDKTGTLTYGDLRVTDVVLAEHVSRESLLSCAAALELQSDHPIAQAIVQFAKQAEIPVSAAADCKSWPGQGVTGLWQGKSAGVGTIAFLQSMEWPIPPAAAEAANGSDQPMVFVATTDQWLGALQLGDVVRDEAAEAVDQLRSIGVAHLGILSGDRSPVVHSVARAVNIMDASGDLLPAEKFEKIREYNAKYQNVVMVGDGVNDAPALAAAGIGIAIGTAASDVALESADVVVLTPDLRHVPRLIRLSRKTRRILWQNIGTAIGIKAACLLLAACGVASMWMAVAADVGASLLVISNGMRLLGNAPSPNSGKSTPH